MKNYIKSIISLTSICAIMAILLAGVNYITAPLIKAQENAAANSALLEVMPDGEDFKAVDVSSYSLPSTVSEVYSEKSGGYVFKLVTTGYASGFTIMCGINADGTVSGAICISSGETLAYEKTYGEKFNNLSIDSLDSIDTISGATKTTAAYKSAIRDALNAFAILGGKDVDIRTEAEILADALNEALPAANGKFSPLFITEVVEGTSAIYVADNGTGSVYLHGDAFIAVDNSGKVISDVSEELKSTIEAQAKLISESKLTKIDLSSFDGIPSSVVEAHKTDSGNYVMLLHASGYGIHGGKYASGEPIVIRLSITGEGKIIVCETVSQKETNGFGSACADPSFYSQFNGKVESNFKDIDAISGATVTTGGYKNAIADAFSALKILKGGTQ